MSETHLRPTGAAIAANDLTLHEAFTQLLSTAPEKSPIQREHITPTLIADQLGFREEYEIQVDDAEDLTKEISRQGYLVMEAA